MFRKMRGYVLVAVLVALLMELFHPLQAMQSFAQPGCQTFKETGKALCGRFLQYWQQNGGLAQQGYPLSGTFYEVSDLNGKSYIVQYFERAVFEYHPENQPPTDVLLSQLGTFQFKRKYPSGEPAAVNPPAALPQGGKPPGATIAGQVIEIEGYYASPIRLTVRSAQETTTLTGARDKYTARGKFVVLFIGAMPLQTRIVTQSGIISDFDLIDEDNLRLVDDQGRRYEMLGVSEHYAAAEQYFRDQPYFRDLKGGRTTEILLAFDTASDANNYKLARTDN